MLDLKAINDIKCRVGEGPVYDDRREVLWYCDILNNTVFAQDLGEGGGLKKWTFDSEVGSLGLADSGKLVVALRNRVGLFDPDEDHFDELAEIEADDPRTRLNDGKVGADGAFWVGTMDDTGKKEPIGSLYRIDASGYVETKIDKGIVTSNGLAFSPDGTAMFHSDSGGPWLDRWDFDSATGAISGRTRIADLDEATGRPDGGATDEEGYYWSAGISAGRLNRFSPSGELVAHYPVPVGAPTCPCFVGPGLDRLCVTSLTEGRDPALLEKFPLTGRLIGGESPVKGAPVSRFRDS